MLKRTVTIFVLLLVLVIFAACATPAELLAEIKAQQTAVAEQWAEALKNRDGQAQYALLTEEQQKNFYDELSKQNGENEVNWLIGSSDFIIENYQVDVTTKETLVTYRAKDPDGNIYIMVEKLSFKQVKDNWLINDYQTVVDYIDEQSYNKQAENQ